MGNKAFDSFYSLAGNRVGNMVLSCRVYRYDVPVPIPFKTDTVFRRTCTYGDVVTEIRYWTINTLKYHIRRAAARYFFHEPVREKSSKKPFGSIINYKKRHQYIDKWGQGLTCYHITVNSIGL